MGNIRDRWQRDDPALLILLIVTVVFVMAFIVEVFA